MSKTPEFYSQNFEDVMLARCFAHLKKGFYVDVGAQLEEADSVTRHFYELGWNGINIEPVSEFAETFKRRYRDVTLCCAVGDKEETRIMTVSLDSGLSSFDPNNINKAGHQGLSVSERNVKIRTLNNILQNLGHSSLAFEFLKIDVEGFELPVIKGIDLTRFRPKVILCEVTLPNTSVKSKDYDSLASIIESYNYEKIYFDGLNQWWCATEAEKEVAKNFMLPPSILDSLSISPYSGTQARQNLRKLQEALASSELNLLQARGELANANHELAARTHELSIFQRDLMKINENLISTKEELSALKASRAWRVTAPLRHASDWTKEVYKRIKGPPK
jgi:FkbM family methyltransferase